MKKVLLPILLMAAVGSSQAISVPGAAYAKQSGAFVAKYSGAQWAWNNLGPAYLWSAAKSHPYISATAVATAAGVGAVYFSKTVRTKLGLNNK